MAEPRQDPAALLDRPSAGRDGAAAGGAAPASLARRTVSAAQWRLASAVVQGGLQFGIGVLLARLLPPEDFGVMALALVVSGLATLVADLGLGPALVQRRDLSPRHLRVAGTTSFLLGLGVTALILLLAPLSGPLLRSPDLPAVLRLQSLVFLFGGLGVVARAVLQRALRFRALFVVQAGSYVVGYAAVATTLALAGFGVWALVWGALTQALLESVLALAFARPPLTPLLARRELRELLGFGAGASLNGVVNYVARNGDNVVVGRWLGAAALGLYGRAYNLMTLPLNYLGTVVYSVLFPAMAEVQDDRARLGRAYLLSVQVTALVTAPVMAGMAVAAPHLAVGLYGPAWAGMALPLQILCVSGHFRAVYHLAGAVTHASARVYAELRLQVVYALLVLAAGWAGTAWGVAGVAIGVALAIGYMYFATAALALRIVGRRWSEFFAAQLPGVLVGGLVAGVALAVRAALERAGAGSGATFVAIMLACMVALPAGVYLLPARFRPAELFARLDGAVARLPRPLRGVMTRVCRLTPAVAP